MKKKRTMGAKGSERSQVWGDNAGERQRGSFVGGVKSVKKAGGGLAIRACRIRRTGRL